MTAQVSLTVGFDLDLTLVDSRPGIAATYEALAAETGAFIDIPLVLSRIGPALETELGHWFAPGDVPAVADRYRELYADLGITSAPALPGAREALEAVRAHGGRTLVVTAKYELNAVRHVGHLSLPVDVVVGGLWAEAKADALRAHGAGVYVGDHLGDIAGARRAGAIAVAVATGPIPAADLAAAGADVVLADLTAFPAWLAGHLAADGLTA